MSLEKIPAKLLYIGDEGYVTNILTKALGRLAQTVFCANDIDTGYIIFLLAKPEVIVTNIKIHLDDNIKITEKIKNIDPYTKTLWICDQAECNPKHDNIDIIIPEPLDIENLIDTVHCMCLRPHLALTRCLP